MSQVNGIRVLIADDHPILRHGLVSLIENEPDMTVVAEACDGREAVDLFARHRPDVALLDLRMPHMQGVDVIMAIRAQFQDARIMVLSTYDHEETIYHALRAGARAYMLKDAPPDELLAAIRSVHAGLKHIPAAIGAKLSEHFASQELTERELEVLKLIVAGNRNKEIGKVLSIAEGTVKYHVNNILTKMGASDRTQAVTLALQRGIVRI